jgi:hypothetical protein
MTVAYLAIRSAAELAVLVGVPAAGSLSLILWFWELSRRPSRPPPGYPYQHPGYPVAAPRRSSAMVLITLGSVLLALGGMGLLGQAAGVGSRKGGHTRSPATGISLRVGQCIGEIQYRTQLFNVGHGCADLGSTYELAARGGAAASCPDGKREHSTYDRFTDEDTILCFALNLRPSQCYTIESDEDAIALGLTLCGDPRQAQVRVMQRIDGRTDTSDCPPGTKAVSYPKPARLYCLARVGTG